MGTIYKITNIINGKCYIGKTIQDVESRWRVHKSNINKFDYPLYRAMRKYGIDNFVFEIIEDNITESLLSEREQYYINLYNSFGEDGYNATIGGEGNPIYNQQEIIAKYKEIGNIQGVMDHFHCSRRPILEAIKKYHIDTGHTKAVYQLDKNTCDIINVFPSQSEAARILFRDENRAKNISAACRGKINSAYGYKWMLVSDKL